MAKTTVVHITDDLDGSDNAQEVAFTVDGVDYIIDLSKKNRAAFIKAVKPYVDAATKVNQRKSSRRRSATANHSDYVKIREWAKANDVAVSDRGRIPASVVDQYKAAH